MAGFFNRKKKTLFPSIDIHKDIDLLFLIKHKYNHRKLKNYIDIYGFLNNY